MVKKSVIVIMIIRGVVCLIMAQATIGSAAGEAEDNLLQLQREHRVWLRMVPVVRGTATGICRMNGLEQEWLSDYGNR